MIALSYDSFEDVEVEKPDPESTQYVFDKHQGFLFVRHHGSPRSPQAGKRADTEILSGDNYVQAALGAYEKKVTAADCIAWRF